MIWFTILRNHNFCETQRLNRTKVYRMRTKSTIIFPTEDNQVKIAYEQRNNIKKGEKNGLQ